MDPKCKYCGDETVYDYETGFCSGCGKGSQRVEVLTEFKGKQYHSVCDVYMTTKACNTPRGVQYWQEVECVDIESVFDCSTEHAVDEVGTELADHLIDCAINKVI